VEVDTQTAYSCVVTPWDPLVCHQRFGEMYRGLRLPPLLKMKAMRVSETLVDPIHGITARTKTANYSCDTELAAVTKLKKPVLLIVTSDTVSVTEMVLELLCNCE
jgi:hypothetical protein